MRLPLGDHLPLPRDGLGEERHRDQDLADRRPADRADDLIRGCLLGQVGRRAGVDGVQERGFGLVGAVEHDRGLRDGGADLGGGHGPAGIGEPEVHEHNRRLLAGRHLGGLIAPPGDADHGQVILALEDPGDGGGEERMVLDDQHSDGVGRGYAQG